MKKSTEVKIGSFLAKAFYLGGFFILLLNNSVLSLGILLIFTGKGMLEDMEKFKNRKE